jgi:non-specific serine/threonine protein kinase
VHRARQATPAFVLTPANAPSVAAICRRLDGLPLAIELAAARVRVLTPAGLLERLDRALPLLSGGARDLPARQRTMRDAIAWSHDLLETGERTLFARLAVFTDGWTIEAAEAVAADPAGADNLPAAEVLTGVAALFEQNLLVSGGVSKAVARFGMLETIRAYGLEQLAASGEEVALRDQHAAYFLALAERGGGMPVGHDQALWLEDLESEGGNLRAAADWCIARGDARRALRLSGALWWFWYIRGHLTEGRARLAAALALPGAADDPARVGALLGAGTLAWRQGDLETALARCEESETLARHLGDERATAWALVFRAHVLGDLGEFATARHHGAAALRLFRSVGDKAGLARTLNGAGEDAQVAGDYARAEALYEECLALDRELGDMVGIVLRQHNLGYVALRRGDAHRATNLFQEGLRSSRALHYGRGIALCLTGLGAVAIAKGQPERGLTLYGAAAALRESIGEVEDLVNRAENEHYIARARAAIGADQSAAAWAAGHARAQEEGTAFALGAAGDSSPPLA